MMHSSKPDHSFLVTVVIPTYNSAIYLAEAVESVLAQTYRRFEIIVVDDGSTDHPQAVLEPFGSKVEYFRQKNLGPSAARNTGIRLGRGEVVAILDADDLWLLDKLEKQVQFMANYRDVGLVFGDAELFNASGMLIPSFFREKLNASRLLGGNVILEDSFELLLGENFIPTSTVVMKRACLAKIGGFDESLKSVEDRDLWLRIARHFPIGCLSDILVRKRVHDFNISSNSHLAVESIVKVTEKAATLLNSTESELDAAVRSHLASRYFGLGYSYFERNDYQNARKNFRISFSKKARAKPALYYLSTLMGKRLVGLVRELKRGILSSNL